MTPRKPPSPETRLTSQRAKRALDAAPDGMTDVRMTFDDEFAPSHAQAYSTDPNAMSNPSARHIFYNQQLFDQLGMAIAQAIRLGFPTIDFGFPLTFPAVSKKTLSDIFARANSYSEYVAEGSLVWLSIQCYIRHALLCNALTDPITRVIEPNPGESIESVEFRQRGLDAMIAIDHGFFLGAAVRELELAVLNRNDALRGKKIVKSARVGGEARKRAVGPDTLQRLTAMTDYIAAGHSIANAARHTATKVGGSFETNKKLWARHHNK